MKKYLKLFLIMVMAVVVITSCKDDKNDVPDTPPVNVGGDTKTLPYNQSFTESFGTYFTYNAIGDQVWTIDYETAKMAGAEKDESGTYVNYDNKDWLISSPVKLTGTDKAKMVMTYIARYFSNLNNDLSIMASTNYEFGSDPTTATWTKVNAALVAGTSWENFVTTEISLNDFVGQEVTFAVKYVSDDVKAGTIEVQSISIEEGEATGGGGGEIGDPEGTGTEDDPYNVAAAIQHQGTDEIGWIEGYLVGCVKNGETTVTSNDQIDWSSPFSSYTNVVIADNADETNIASCVIVNLPSGSVLRQKVNLFDNSGNHGKVLEVNGKLRTYFGQAGLRDSDGSAASFYIDGVLGGGGDVPPVGDAIFSETFATGQGDFTIFDVVLPEGLTYVWNYAANYSCMKGSAFLGSAFETESWLISPAIDMSGNTSATLTFDHAARYGEDYPNTMEVMVSTNYNSGDPTSASWTKITVPTYPDGSSWTFLSSGAMDLSSYTGNTNVRIAFKYTSSDSAASTWEVKNVLIQE